MAIDDLEFVSTLEMIIVKTALPQLLVALSFDESGLEIRAKRLQYQQHIRSIPTLSNLELCFQSIDNTTAFHEQRYV